MLNNLVHEAHFKNNNNKDCFNAASGEAVKILKWSVYIKLSLIQKLLIDYFFK